MDKVIRVNLGNLKVMVEKIGKEYVNLGGRGLVSEIISKEVPPLCHPLSKENKIIFSPGLLCGTPCPCSGRLSVGAKSPLTGTIKESNAGGTAAQKLSRLGISALIIEGKPEDKRLYLLKISKDKYEIESADELRGLGNYDTISFLTKKYGDKVSYISIGHAGERKMSAASIAVTDMENRPTRHAGRGGLGAVMGSKGLKAIVIDDKGADKISIKDKDTFMDASKRFTRALEKHHVTGDALPTYGTNVLTNIINEAGAYPTRNFSSGKFENAEKIGGEAHRNIILKRGGIAKHSCHPGCIIQCSRIYHDEKGNYLTKGPEYETLWANGGNLEIDDLDTIANMDRLYDDYGLDTIEIGVAIGLAMEAGIKKFGDKEGAIELLKEIGKATPLGYILGNGAAVTGQVFGLERVPVVKGQSLPAYDPRHAKGVGVTYATSPMGADHTAGYSITANILKIGGSVDPLKSEGQIELSRNLQIATAFLDTTGLCLFVAFCLLDDNEAFNAVIDMLNSQYDLKLTEQDVIDLGRRIIKTENEFNRRAGFSNEASRLPSFFEKEKIPPHNITFDITHEELDKVWE